MPLKSTPSFWRALARLRRAGLSMDVSCRQSEAALLMVPSTAPHGVNSIGAQEAGGHAGVAWEAVTECLEALSRLGWPEYAGCGLDLAHTIEGHHVEHLSFNLFATVRLG